MKKAVFENSKNSTLLAEMKMIAHGADGFVLFPTKTKRKELGEVQALQALHTHLYYEFFFAMEEPVTIVTATGAESVSHGVIIVPPSVKHFAVAESGGGYRISVTESEVKTIGGKLGLLELIPKTEITPLKLNEEGEYYLKKLVSAHFFSEKGRLKGEALLKLLFLELEGLLRKDEGVNLPVSVDGRYRNVEKIDHYLGKNYARADAKVEELAEILCLSVRQTARVLKKEYGKSFVELINDKRMEVAAALLKRSRLSVGEILRELNFETENYFYRLFKKYYGVTPLKYRKAHFENISE